MSPCENLKHASTINVKIQNISINKYRISNQIHDKVQDEITYFFPNFSSAVFEVWKWISNFIPLITEHYN